METFVLTLALLIANLAAWALCFLVPVTSKSPSRAIDDNCRRHRTTTPVMPNTKTRFLEADSAAGRTIRLAASRVT